MVYIDRIFVIAQLEVFLRAEEMSIFPRISLKTEVTDHLKSIFLNKEVGIFVLLKNKCTFYPPRNSRHAHSKTVF